MNKKRAKINFILTSVLVVIALVLCFAQFKLPYSNNNFNGFFNSISASNDISQGYCAVYEITSNATDEEVENTIVLMRDLISRQGIDTANVYRQGDYIRAEVQSTNATGNVLAIIGNPQDFYISGENKTTIKETELESYAIKGTDIKNAYATTQVYMDKESNGITIEFTKSGAEKYHELTKQVSATEDSKIYFYIGGQSQNSGLEIEGESDDDFLSFYFDGKSVSFDDAKTFALQILMSSTGVNLEIVSNSLITPTLGQNVLTLIMVGLMIAIVSIIILFPLFFGDLGLVADLSLLVGVALNVFLLQALPLTTSSVAGIIGSMIGIGLLVVAHAKYLLKMKKEFASLKKLQLSARTAFKKTWLKNLDLCAIPFIGGVALAVFNIPFVSTFGVSLAIGSFVALFNTIVVFKDFVTWYVYINPKNYKRIKFTKEAGNE